jgi:hypothetical protein|tara:strand:- start:3406 stop:3693 length:288 start_codon:yes stop_codon:yes gene_type:complete
MNIFLMTKKLLIFNNELNKYFLKNININKSDIITIYKKSLLSNSNDFENKLNIIMDKNKNNNNIKELILDLYNEIWKNDSILFYKKIKPINILIE